MSQQEENALICEKLLGWVNPTYKTEIPAWVVPSKDGEYQPTRFETPSFATWAEAGLILEALDKKDEDIEVGNGVKNGVSGWYCRVSLRSINDAPFCNTAQLAIRAAALAYIRSMP
jgi:hypothetical protein